MYIIEPQFTLLDYTIVVVALGLPVETHLLQGVTDVDAISLCISKAMKTPSSTVLLKETSGMSDEPIILLVSNAISTGRGFAISSRYKEVVSLASSAARGRGLRPTGDNVTYSSYFEREGD